MPSDRLVPCRIGIILQTAQTLGCAKAVYNTWYTSTGSYRHVPTSTINSRIKLYRYVSTPMNQLRWECRQLSSQGLLRLLGPAASSVAGFAVQRSPGATNREHRYMVGECACAAGDVTTAPIAAPRTPPRAAPYIARIIDSQFMS